MRDSDRFPTDDITWCMAECETDCPRQPKYIRDKSIPHSFADFSSGCMAYVKKGADGEYAGCRNCEHQPEPLRMCEWGEKRDIVELICSGWELKG